MFNDFDRAQTAGEPDAVRVLDPLRLRYFSPTELLRLFQFDDPSDLPSASVHKPVSFIWPDDISKKAKYKLIGNSVNVKVVTSLIVYLFLSE